MINANARKQAHKFTVRFVGAAFVISSLIGGGFAGAHFNNDTAASATLTSVNDSGAGLCVVGCGFVSGSGSVGGASAR